MLPVRVAMDCGDWPVLGPRKSFASSSGSKRPKSTSTPSSGVSRYCLDTSAYSHFQRGTPLVVDLIDAADRIGLPSIVLGELRVGFHGGRHSQRNEQTLREFLDVGVVEQLVVDDEVSVHYAEIVGELRLRGTPIPTNDIWIAATAAQAGLSVLTFDQHFATINRVASVILRDD